MDEPATRPIELPGVATEATATQVGRAYLAERGVEAVEVRYTAVDGTAKSLHVRLDPWPTNDVVDWIRSRPPEVRALMRRFPPMAKVKAKEGVKLMVPAPGVVGEVASWFEDGSIGVAAPMARTLTSPITGYTAHEGETLRGQCQADALELVEYGPLTAADVAAALDG